MTVGLATTIAARALILLGLGVSARAHDIITTSITFDKEIVRIIHARCARCHREGGSAFSLMTYKEARPWAQAIKEETLSRRMPPWGAVKGFGEFRNDEALSNEQIETIVGWIDGGVPEGDEATLPPAPTFPASKPALPKPQTIVTDRGYVLTRAMNLDGLIPLAAPQHTSMQIIAVLPDGNVTPLVWLDTFQEKFRHAFLLETPVLLPAGTRIEGLTAGAKIGLLQAPNPKQSRVRKRPVE